MSQHTPPSGKVPLPAIILAKTTFAQAAVFQQTLMRIVETVNNHHPNLYSVAHEPALKYPFRWTILGSETCVFFELRLDENNPSHFEVQMHMPTELTVHCYMAAGQALDEAINGAIHQIFLCISPPAAEPGPVQPKIEH